MVSESRLVHLAAHGDDVKAARPFGQGAHALGKVALARKFAFGYDKSFVHSISSVHSFNSFAPLGGVSGANGSKRYSASAMFSVRQHAHDARVRGRAQFEQHAGDGRRGEHDVGRCICAHAPPPHLAKRQTGGKFVEGTSPLP